MNHTGDDFDWSNISNNTINAMKFAAQQANIRVTGPQTKANYVRALTQYRDEQMKATIEQPQSQRRNSRSPTPISPKNQSPSQMFGTHQNRYLILLKTDHVLQCAIIVFIVAFILLLLFTL